MTREEEQFAKRVKNMADKAYYENRYQMTRFLNEMEQDVVLQSEREFPIAVSFTGGYELAERKIAVFGSEELFGYEPIYPIRLLKIEPVAKKFADELTHRDVLGAVLNLGMEREMIGDILFDHKVVYLFCVEPMDQVILDQLGKIKHTIVRVTRAELDEVAQLSLGAGEERQVLVSSMRLDAVVAAVYHLSRQESQLLIREKKVFVSGRLNENNSGLLKGECMISVRGKGRFYLNGVLYETKKGKLQISINQY